MCTQSHTNSQHLPLHPATKLLLLSPFLLSPIKNRQDKSITSSIHTHSSSWLSFSLIIHSCQPMQLSLMACTVRCSIMLQGYRDSYLYQGGKEGFPIMAEIVFLSYLLEFCATLSCNMSLEMCGNTTVMRRLLVGLNQ